MNDGVSGRLFRVPSDFTPNTTEGDGTQALVLLTVSSGISLYQDVNAVYEAGFEYRLTAYLGQGEALTESVIGTVDLRTTGGKLLRSKAYSR